jgi:Spy/CpxP family protein refolding chaperone
MLKHSVLAGGLGVLLVSLTLAQPGGFPGGPPGGGGFQPPQPGQILPTIFRDQLKLTNEQKKQLDALQKEVDAKLDKLFTDEQKKQWKEMKDNPFRGFGGPGGGPGGPGGPGGGGFGGPGGGGFGGPGGRGPGGFGGGPGTARMDDVKKQLGATDEEWKVINPKLQKVLTARQVLSGESSGDRGFFGGPGTNPIGQARTDLKTVLDDPKHSKADVEEKVAAVRKARQKAQADLEAAQQDLRQMLSAFQEAVLVSLGYLE